ncbi:protein SLOW GREEN 1, chloroplastic [Iris pallida]|uniref:Protein SLOW GREEN 1, chloroplastic n=1 Tax=Iris pallida TaxID=29817 RepID=A0AAX6E964_IRIPA|nr:protein SLOW GREEN 1, chloroplastic [Iris pallida]
MPPPHRPPLRQALCPFPRHRRPGPASRRRARIDLQPHRALLRNHRIPPNPPLPEAQRRRGLRRPRPPRPPPTPPARRARVEVPCRQAPQRDGRHRVLPEDLRGDPRGRPPLLRGPLRERRPHGPLRRARRHPPAPRVGAGGRQLGEVGEGREADPGAGEVPPERRRGGSGDLRGACEGGPEGLSPVVLPGGDL